MMQIQFPQAPLVALVALVSLVALKAAPCVPLAHTFAAWLRHSQNWQVKVPDAPDIGRPPGHAVQGKGHIKVGHKWKIFSVMSHKHEID